MRRVQFIDRNGATYLRGLGGFESTCCTVEVSSLCLLVGGLTCTELVLVILDEDGCGDESDFTLLRSSGTSLPYVDRGVGGVRLRRWDNVGGVSFATGSRVAGDGEPLAVLWKQPMGMIHQNIREIELDI